MNDSPIPPSRDNDDPDAEWDVMEPGENPDSEASEQKRDLFDPIQLMSDYAIDNGLWWDDSPEETDDDEEAFDPDGLSPSDN